MDEVSIEIELLRRFAEEKLRKGSFVYEKVQDLVLQAQREHARHLQSSANQKAEVPSSCKLVVRFNIATIRDPRSVELSPGSTLLELKKEIEKSIGQMYTVERILVRRTGKAWGSFDTKTLAQCEIKNGDELVVDGKSADVANNLRGQARVISSGIVASSPFARLALALHAFLLDLEFVTVVEMPSTVPGFAPSLKELPKTLFVPSDWNKLPGEVGILYKHKAAPGKQFQLSCVDMGESVMVSLAQRGGGVQSMELSLAQYTTVTSAQETDIQQPEVLEESLQRLVYSLLSQLRTKPAPAAAASSGAQAGTGPAAMEVEPPSAYAPRIPAYGPGVGGGAAGTGGADMDPFYGGVHIGGGRGAGAGMGVGPAGGNGNLVGPNHPMFNPAYYEDPSGYGGEWGPGGIGGMGGLPQPRFDPFGPVLGPNQDIGGAGVGNVGIPGRGGRGGRGPGRGPGRGGNFPGEPNPDHFRPPGW